MQLLRAIDGFVLLSVYGAALPDDRSFAPQLTDSANPTTQLTATRKSLLWVASVLCYVSRKSGNRRTMVVRDDGLHTKSYGAVARLSRN